MAGRVQIAALGELSDSLSINPSFSFFTKRYSRYTNYATENYKISFPEGVYTDDFLDVPIPQRYGDILQDITISFVVNPTHVSNLGSNLSPIDIFGISVIDYVELYVGDQKIDTITSDDIFIEREFKIPESYRSSVDALHGKHFQGSSDREFLQEFYDGQYNTQGIDPFTNDEYRIGIPFYFHRRPGHGFPLCALREQELSLRIKLRPTIDVIFATQELFGDNIWDPRANNQLTERLELSNFKVNLDIVHLNAVERSMLQNRPMNILFEQHQRNHFQIEPQSKVGDFKLEFKNCVKELFFIAKKIGKWSETDISILDQLRQLDDYTKAQESTLTILKQIPVWGGMIWSILDNIVGKSASVRESEIDTILQSIYWTQTEVDILNALKDPNIDPATEASHIATLKQYLDSLPGQVLGIQSTADTTLKELQGELNPTTRNVKVEILLNLGGIWGETETGLLNLLRTPGLPEESLYIFGLRAYVKFISYYLPGLDALKPGTPEQIEVVNKLKEFLDITKITYDILKYGLKYTIQQLPGKTAYIRGLMIDAILQRSSGLSYPDGLDSLRVNPGNNETIIQEQRQTIINNVIYLGGLLDLNTTILTNLDSLGGEDVIGLRQDTVNGLLTITGYWTQPQIDLLNLLAEEDDQTTREGYVQTLSTYVNAQTPQDSLYVNTLINDNLTDLDGETNQAVREGIVGALLLIESFWTQTETDILNALKDPILALGGTPQEDAYISQLRIFADAKFVGLKLLVEGMVGSDNTTGIVPTELPLASFERRFANVEVLRGIPIWGDDIIKLVLNYDSAPSTYAPILTGYLQGVQSGIPALIVQINILKAGINGVLNSLPSDPVERDITILTLATLREWTDEEFYYLSLLRVPTPNDGAYVAALQNLTSDVSVMTRYSQFEQNQIIDGIISRNIWGQAYFALNILRLITPGFVGEQNAINELVTYLQGLSGDYTTEIATLNSLGSLTAEYRYAAVLQLENLEDVWGEQERFRLLELRIAGSVNHADYIDNNIIAYLIALSGTIDILTNDIGQGTATSTTLQDSPISPIKIAAWGGYFYYLLENLKNPAITQTVIDDSITALTTYINLTSLSEERNTNLQFLITQITVKYPEPIFNKWIRAKKNVPLMYSKQRTTTLECDGVKILDEITGSNMFLSASIPNLYHKRSPNFRNINTYSFALYPDELRPSGHLNFSTIKDAKIHMELEYDGAHGAFDFDDNLIQSFGIDPIYFPKQVIIIAKSYNMMIIRNGKMQIIY